LFERPQFQILLVDRLTRTRGADVSGLPMAVRRSLGRISGTIYEDVNGDSVFVPGSDRALRDVVVIVDCRYYVRTDGAGRFRLDALEPGAHELTIDFTTIRADLALAGPPSRRFTVVAGAEVMFDVVAARSGRLRGEAWLDENDNGVRDQGGASDRVRTPSAAIR
jgi:hypothetical protein